MIAQKILVNAMIENIDIPLYSSTKDEQKPDQEIVNFVPEGSIVYDMKKPLKNSQPVYARTIIPTKTRFIPDITKNHSSVFSVDHKRMKKFFTKKESKNIISDIENNNPLPEKISSILVKENIISEPTLSETMTATEQILLPSNPIIQSKENKITISKNKTILDKITNIIYKIIYKN